MDAKRMNFICQFVMTFSNGRYFHNLQNDEQEQILDYTKWSIFVYTDSEN